MSTNPLLDLIRRGESGAAGYNAYNRGTYVGSDGKEHIRGADRPIDFSTLTLAQVQELQHASRRDPDRLFAVGKYQIIPQTMDGAVASLRLDPSQRFTPQLQDRVFSEYLIVTKRPAIHDYIAGKPGVTMEQAQYALSCEWASFGDPRRNGRSHYGGANHASITLEQSAAALNQMRTSYKASIDSGMTPDQAWRSVTGGDLAHGRTAAASAPTPRPEVATAAGAAITLNAAYDMGIRHDDVRYGLGAKNLASGRIDCAGWIKELQNATMAEINRESGRTIFSGRDYFTTTTSDQMIRQTVEKSGVLLKSPLTASTLREGMIIGENNGKQSWEPAGRFNGIDHITMVVRDPKSGGLMISQSRGGEGVEMIPLERYLSTKQSRGVELYATDPLAKARDLLPGHAPTAAPARQPVDRPSAGADGVLQQGESGPEVVRLQENLRRLGYTDARGRSLAASGNFDEHTKQALQAFQREHGLQGLGVAGPKTREAMAQADAQLLTNPGHPLHARYQEVLAKVHSAEAQRGIKPGPHSEQLAGALTVEVVRERIARVDRVELNEQGTLARVVQVNPMRDEAALNRTTDAVGTQQACAQSIAESSRQAQQVATNVRLQQEEQQRSQAHTQAVQPATAH